MSFFALCDTFTDHPKAVKAGNAALGAWARMGSYAAHHLTDGVIPRAVCRRIATRSQIDRLTTAGLLEVQPDGDFVMHDYLEYNPSKAEVLALKAAKSKAGAKGAAKRWKGEKPIAPAIAPAHGSSHGNSIALPSPPLPSPLLSTPTESHPSAARRVFDFWRESTGHSRAKFDTKRRKRIASRLAEGFTVEELCEAIEHREHDPWLMGRGESPRVYDDLATLLRDAAQVERLRDLTTPIEVKPKGNGYETPLQREEREAAAYRGVSDEEWMRDDD